jgi:hypothetical protein
MESSWMTISPRTLSTCRGIALWPLWQGKIGKCFSLIQNSARHESEKDSHSRSMRRGCRVLPCHFWREEAQKQQSPPVAGRTVRREPGNFVSFARATFP